MAVACVVAAFLLFLVWLWHNDPAQTLLAPKCPVFMLTGFRCPGCGTGRAIYQVMHGNFLEAFRLNAALFPALLFLLVLFLVRNRPIYHKLTSSTACLVVLILIILYTILRNCLGV